MSNPNLTATLKELDARISDGNITKRAEIINWKLRNGSFDFKFKMSVYVLQRVLVRFVY